MQDTSTQPDGSNPEDATELESLPLTILRREEEQTKATPTTSSPKDQQESTTLSGLTEEVASAICTTLKGYG